MNEFQLIRTLTNRHLLFHKNTVLGTGDDCAVLPYSPSRYLLYTTDSLVENVHFRTSWLGDRSKLFTLLGWKALAVNVSDVLAMAGTPSWALVSLHLPRRITVTDLQCLYRGLRSCAQEYRVSIAGGNMSRSHRAFVIVVSLLGTIKKEHLLLRSRARVHDWVHVQEGVGRSSAGLDLLNKGCRQMNKLILSHLKPCPDMDWLPLLKKYSIHAAIDISDGLIGDLEHVLDASGAGCEIFRDRLPLSGPLKGIPPSRALRHLLYGGEDYKVLFTSKQRIAAKGIACIGRIIRPRGIYLVSAKGRVRLGGRKGFSHF